MRNTPICWYRILMIAGGFGFGLFADWRPFGETVLGHPIVMFAGTAALGLLTFRALLARPVPEVIPERTIVAGFLIGIAAFLAGNWTGVHLLAPR